MKHRRLNAFGTLATALGCAALVGALAWPAFSQEGEPQPAEEALPAQTVVIDVDSPDCSLYRIAVPNVMGPENMGSEGAEVMRNDFRLVSLFEVLNARSFVANLESEGLGIAPDAWQAVGAQGVIKGRITRDGNRIQVEMRLYEVARGGSATLTRTYSGRPGELRQFMHEFANEVMQVLTGRRGAFGTRLVFARRRGPGRKDIMVASFDGDRVSRVSSGEGISMLPAFGRGGIWYSILTEERMFITHTGIEDRPIIEGEGLNMGVSVCGSRAYFSSTRDGNAEIYSANLDGTDVRRLTDHPGIDVSPACGGPGGLIAFVSTRHGSPQIFTMNAAGGAVTRVTYRGHHNQTPAWCPSNEDGPLLAFTGQSGGFDVFTVNLATQEYRRLTQGQGTNKDRVQPGLPDGRLLLLARRHLHLEPRRPEPEPGHPRTRRDAPLVPLRSALSVARPRLM